MDTVRWTDSSNSTIQTRLEIRRTCHIPDFIREKSSIQTLRPRFRSQRGAERQWQLNVFWNQWARLARFAPTLTQQERSGQRRVQIYRFTWECSRMANERGWIKIVMTCDYWFKILTMLWFFQDYLILIFYLFTASKTFSSSLLLVI